MSERRPVTIGGEAFAGYQITSDGQVLSFWEEIDNGAGGIRWGIRKTLHKLMPWLVNGYPTVSLRRDGKTRSVAIHRLVAEAFIGVCPKGLEVCHSDGVRANCAATNLRYDTRKNNLADREKHGTSQRGERNPAATITNAQAEQIRKMRRAGALLRPIAAKFGIRESTVSRIANGVRRAKL